MELRNIRDQKAKVIIGKNGVSPGIIKTILEIIKQEGVVKVKILKTALDMEYTKKDLIQDLTIKSNLDVMETRGYSVILIDPKLKKNR